MKIATIGHSSQTLDSFMETLHAHGIQMLVDVRRYPKSRRYPHFNREPLARALKGQGIGYKWLEDLGGMRKEKEDSPHIALKAKGLASYADYTATESFINAVQLLLELAEQVPTTLMCAEAHYTKCHRQLIADWLEHRTV